MSKAKEKRENVPVTTYDTKIGVLEKQHGVDLGVDEEMKLGTYLEKKGYPSLADMLKSA